MLKIKDDVDLKILLQYGFKRINYIPYYQKNVYYDEHKTYSFIEYLINTKTRKIEIRIIDTSKHTEFIIDDTLYELIKANLIERVND